jgi:hypothetical protein
MGLKKLLNQLGDMLDPAVVLRKNQRNTQGPESQGEAVVCQTGVD